MMLFCLKVTFENFFVNFKSSVRSLQQVGGEYRYIVGGRYVGGEGRQWLVGRWSMQVGIQAMVGRQMEHVGGYVGNDKWMDRYIGGVCRWGRQAMVGRYVDGWGTMETLVDSKVKIVSQMKKVLIACLGVKPGVAGWKAQTNPLSYGGTPGQTKFEAYFASAS